MTAAAGRAGLRWVVGQRLPDDTVYAGTAGVLRAFAEARTGGIREYDDAALAIRDALLARRFQPRRYATDNGSLAGTDTDTSLYCGAAGRAAALACWAAASGDETAAAGARRIAGEIAGADRSPVRDLLLGDAGVVLLLVDHGELTGAARFAEGLVEAAEPVGAGVDWRQKRDAEFVMPNLSHGTAGVAFALARAGRVLHRPELFALARAGAARLLEIGLRADGGVAVPHSIPQQSWAAAQSWGWCHGPTGTVQVFLELARAEPGWDDAVCGSLTALRHSGLPARRYPGFWDNVGQCCGTAGVGELALDRYQATGDTGWLDWADHLAGDLLDHATAVGDDLCWSNVEHTVANPVLPPQAGWMQGTAGVAAFLLRLARLHRDGRAAPRLPWPDRVAP
jgi:lantibiotic modifying enzyme